jgi:hypothetical protein
MILVLFIAPQALCSQDSPQVTNLAIRPETNEVELTVQGPIEYGYFPLSDPDRLVFDFPGAVLVAGEGQTISEEVELACFSLVRISQFSQDPPIVRLVMYLDGPASATVNFSPSSGKLVICVIPDGWAGSYATPESVIET